MPNLNMRCTDENKIPVEDREVELCNQIMANVDQIKWDIAVMFWGEDKKNIREIATKLKRSRDFVSVRVDGIRDKVIEECVKPVTYSVKVF